MKKEINILISAPVSEDLGIKPRSYTFGNVKKRVEVYLDEKLSAPTSAKLNTLSRANKRRQLGA